MSIQEGEEQTALDQAYFEIVATAFDTPASQEQAYQALSRIINHLLAPLIGDFSHHIQSLSPEDILGKINEMPTPLLFPNMYFREETWGHGFMMDKMQRLSALSALPTFLQYYFSGHSDEENMFTIEHEEAIAWQKTRTITDKSEDEQFEEFMHAMSLSHTKKYYYQLKQDFGVFMPASLEERNIIIETLQRFQSISPIFPEKTGHGTKLATAQQRAPQMITLFLKEIGGLSPFFDHTVFQLPEYRENSTVLCDLLTAMNVVYAQIPTLFPLAEALFDNAPHLVSDEIIRAMDKNGKRILADTFTEGFLSVMQSCAVAFIQLSQDHPDLDEEDLMDLIFAEEIPVQTAAHIPPGYIGPTTILGLYLSGFYELTNTHQIKIPQHIIDLCKEIKRQQFANRNQKPPFQNADTYLATDHHRQAGATLVFASGHPCLAAQRRIERDDHTRTSVVAEASAILYFVYHSIRKLRAAGVYTQQPQVV